MNSYLHKIKSHFCSNWHFHFNPKLAKLCTEKDISFDLLEKIPKNLTDGD